MNGEFRTTRKSKKERKTLPEMPAYVLLVDRQTAPRKVIGQRFCVLLDRHIVVNYKTDACRKTELDAVLYVETPTCSTTLYDLKVKLAQC